MPTGCDREKWVLSGVKECDGVSNVEKLPSMRGTLSPLQPQKGKGGRKCCCPRNVRFGSYLSLYSVRALQCAVARHDRTYISNISSRKQVLMPAMGGLGVDHVGRSSLAQPRMRCLTGVRRTPDVMDFVIIPLFCYNICLRWKLTLDNCIAICTCVVVVIPPLKFQDDAILLTQVDLLDTIADSAGSGSRPCQLPIFSSAMGHATRRQGGLT